MSGLELEVHVLDRYVEVVPLLCALLNHENIVSDQFVEGSNLKLKFAAFIPVYNKYFHLSVHKVRRSVLAIYDPHNNRHVHPVLANSYEQLSLKEVRLTMLASLSSLTEKL